MPVVEQIVKNGIVLGVVISPGDTGEQPDSSRFLTRDSAPLQLGVMSWSAGRVSDPHRHPPRTRIITETHEVLIVTKGELRVEFYDDHLRYVAYRRCGPGSIVLLSGPHGLRAITDVEMIEVKQGPYDSTLDKVRFLPSQE